MGTKKYSNKIRNKALKFIDKGYNLRQVSELVGVSLSSVHGWNQQRLKNPIDNSIIKQKEEDLYSKTNFEIKKEDAACNKDGAKNPWGKKILKNTEKYLANELPSVDSKSTIESLSSCPVELTEIGLEIKENTSIPSDYNKHKNSLPWKPQRLQDKDNNFSIESLYIKNKQEIDFEDFRDLIINKIFMIENYVINESSIEDLERLKILNINLEKILLGEY